MADPQVQRQAAQTGAEGLKRRESGALDAMTLPLFQLSVRELLEDGLLQTRDRNKTEEDRRSREQGMHIGQGLKMLQQPGEQAPYMKR